VFAFLVEEFRAIDRNKHHVTQCFGDVHSKDCPFERPHRFSPKATPASLWLLMRSADAVLKLRLTSTFASRLVITSTGTSAKAAITRAAGSLRRFGGGQLAGPVAGVEPRHRAALRASHSLSTGLRAGHLRRAAQASDPWPASRVALYPCGPARAMPIADRCASDSIADDMIAARQEAHRTDEDDD